MCWKLLCNSLYLEEIMSFPLYFTRPFIVLGCAPGSALASVSEVFKCYLIEGGAEPKETTNKLL